MRKGALKIVLWMFIPGITWAGQPAGLQKGVWKFSSGTMYHRALQSDNYSVTGEFERLISQHYGLTVGFNAGIHSPEKEAQSYHFYQGINLHAFTGSAFDIFIGGRGGFTSIFVGKERTMNPTINIFAGLSLYYGRLSLDIECGYAAYGRSIDGEPYRDHSALRATSRVGFLIR